MPNRGGLCQQSSKGSVARRSHRTGRRTDSPATVPPYSQGPGSGAPATVCHCGGTGVGPVQVRSWTPSASGLQAHHFGPSGLVLHPRPRRCRLVARGRRGRPEAGWSRHDRRGWDHCPYPRLRRRPYRFPSGRVRGTPNVRGWSGHHLHQTRAARHGHTDGWHQANSQRSSPGPAGQPSTGHRQGSANVRRRRPICRLSRHSGAARRKHPCAKMPIGSGPPLTAADPAIGISRTSIGAGSVAASTVGRSWGGQPSHDHGVSPVVDSIRR
jgi:hypothetical protein